MNMIQQNDLNLITVQKFQLATCPVVVRALPHFTLTFLWSTGAACAGAVGVVACHTVITLDTTEQDTDKSKDNLEMSPVLLPTLLEPALLPRAMKSPGKACCPLLFPLPLILEALALTTLVL